MKQLVHDGYEMDYEQLLHRSASLIVPVINSHNTKEGMTAFIEKRRPRWKME
jgi:enoyl-CoA hydratase/carnithine racemase